MQKINVLVVDDERYAREELIFLLGKYPDLNIIGEAGRGEDAIVQALQKQPDIVFLDVEMPVMNGLAVAKSLVEMKKIPLIVFATAYPQFAAEAFRIDALDYLLKPYNPVELAQTIERARQKLQPKEEDPVVNPLGKLAVERDGEINYIFVKDILYVTPQGKSSIIRTKTNEYVVKSLLKELEPRLFPFGFFRIHRSYLVNLNAVVRLIPWFNGAYELGLEGLEEKLPVSRNYAKELLKRLDV